MADKNEGTATGNWGKILYIDLSKKEVQEKKFSDKTYRDFIGGSGLASKILYDETDANTDPLGPDNVLVFMAGPLTGTTAPLSGRHAIASLSPLTEIWGEADSGGSWGHYLKKAGWDGIVFKGISASPVYVYVNNSEVELVEAGHLWGKDTFETDKTIKDEIGIEDISISCIGQGGENLVRFACVVNDGLHGRVAGRCGLGAVMGSKKLKAIAVKGDQKVPIHDKERLSKISKIITKNVLAATKRYQDYGTSNQVEAVVR